MFIHIRRRHCHFSDQIYIDLWGKLDYCILLYSKLDDQKHWIRSISNWFKLGVNWVNRQKTNFGFHHLKWTWDASRPMSFTHCEWRIDIHLPSFTRIGVKTTLPMFIVPKQQDMRGHVQVCTGKAGGELCALKVLWSATVGWWLHGYQLNIWSTVIFPIIYPSLSNHCIPNVLGSTMNCEYLPPAAKEVWRSGCALGLCWRERFHMAYEGW